MMNAILKEFAQLGKYEKFEVIEQLWDSIDADENAPPMSEALYQELERRAQWSAQNPGQGKTIREIAAGLGITL
jgi:putative addiction module component (TIGR02574 family)